MLMFLFVLYKWLNETVYVLSLRTNRHNVASTAASAATSCIFCWIFFFTVFFTVMKESIYVAESESRVRVRPSADQQHLF